MAVAPEQARAYRQQSPVAVLLCCDSRRDYGWSGFGPEHVGKLDVTAGGLVSLRHAPARCCMLAVSSATQRDLDRGGEEDVRNDGASSRSCSSTQKVEGFNVVAV